MGQARKRSESLQSNQIRCLFLTTFIPGKQKGTERLNSVPDTTLFQGSSNFAAYRLVAVLASYFLELANSPWKIEQNNGNTADTTYVFIIMALDHLLPSVQAKSFFEWTCTSLEQSAVEFLPLQLQDIFRLL